MTIKQKRLVGWLRLILKWLCEQQQVVINNYLETSIFLKTNPRNLNP
jgi:hypothetical protein